MIDPQWAQIGADIASIRKSRKLSQAVVASKVGISRPSLSDIERGKRPINILELKLLSEAIGFYLDIKNMKIGRTRKRPPK